MSTWNPDGSTPDSWTRDPRERARFLDSEGTAAERAEGGVSQAGASNRYAAAGSADHRRSRGGAVSAVIDADR